MAFKNQNRKGVPLTVKGSKGFLSQVCLSVMGEGDVCIMDERIL